MIGGNGSYVEDQGTVVLHQLITPEQCRHIVDWLHNRGLEFYLESNNGLFASERFEACHDSVCMGSGGEEAKQAADYVTDAVDKDGLYKAFEYLELL